MTNLLIAIYISARTQFVLPVMLSVRDIQMRYISHEHRAVTVSIDIGLRELKY